MEYILQYSKRSLPPIEEPEERLFNFDLSDKSKRLEAAKSAASIWKAIEEEEAALLDLIQNPPLVPPPNDLLKIYSNFIGLLRIRYIREFKNDELPF